MEFGIFHEFLTTQTGSQAEAFAQSFAQIEAAESWGLDAVWLAEIHMNPNPDRPTTRQAHRGS